MPARVRVLAWLIDRGASTLRTVRIHQSALARELAISPDSVYRALHALSRGGYIVAVHNPFTDGRVYSYRLAFSHEAPGGGDA